jgi:hypothetical protein
MEMFDLFIIGHSLTDFDLDLVLREAKQTVSARNPIYMTAPGINSGMSREYFESYNIVLIGYESPDGSHSNLRHSLASADKIILHRDKHFTAPRLTEQDRESAIAASTLLIFRRLQAIRSQGAAVGTEYLGPLLLWTLHQSEPLSIAGLANTAPLATVVASDNSSAEALLEVVKDLRSQGLIEGSVDYRLSKNGAERVAEVEASRRLERDRAFGQFEATLRGNHPGLTSEEVESAQLALENTIVRAFKVRGLALANAILADRSCGADELTDLFAEVFKTATTLPAGDKQAAFVDSAREFLISPTSPQRQYLASISQGYFLYNMVGLDPTCSKIRHDLFAKTAWFFDSSIVLPLLAVGSHNHSYAIDFFGRLRSMRAQVYVTRRMVMEAWKHLQWAIQFIKQNPSITPRFLAALLVMPGYKQNLFLDGFVRLAAEGRAGTFEDYLGLMSPTSLTFAKFLSQLKAYGVRVTDMASMRGYRVEDLGELPDLQDAIRQDRITGDTFRSDLQVQAEAEVLHIVHSLRNDQYELSGPAERIYFVSQSNVLNRVTHRDDVITWPPEAVYRYLNALPGEITDPDLLQECMLHDYFYAGVAFIDRPRYEKFFGGAINSARLLYPEQKDAYLRDTEATSQQELDDRFEKIPDLQKPLFVSRMTFHNVRAAEERAASAKQRAEDAEAKVKLLEAEKKKGWRALGKKRQAQAAAEERNSNDPKRQRKLAKRRKAKARGKKK